MSEALIALHYQNDICHPEGRIPFALRHGSEASRDFLAASRQALDAARAARWTIVHIHIGFAADYGDLPRNAPLFARVEELGAVKRGSWGATSYEGFDPLPGELFLTHACNSGFHGTGLQERLAERSVDRVSVMGLATQFSVEHTVRDAADLGYRVTVLAACCASANREAHDASLKLMAMLATVSG